MINDEIIEMFYPMATATDNQKLIAIGIGRAIEMRVAKERTPTLADQDPVAMAHRLQVANDCCERLMSACTDAGCPDGVNMADWIRKNATRTPKSVTRDAMQEKVIACGFKYWRASDAHGVVGTTKQAEEFIADLIGVEVEIKND